MGNIILDGTKIKVYEMLVDLCTYCNETTKWRDDLWKLLLTYNELYDEFVYYLENHSIKGELKVEGYTLFDLYVKQIDLFNIRSDVGKNTSRCNKEDMVLRAFYMMGMLIQNPEHYKRQMEDGFGMDRL